MYMYILCTYMFMTVCKLVNMYIHVSTVTMFRHVCTVTNLPVSRWSGFQMEGPASGTPTRYIVGIYHVYSMYM
jgi:hypothetical protein